VRYSADGSETSRFEFGDRVCGLGFLDDGSTLVVSMLDRRLLAVRGSTVETYADLSRRCAGFLLDMVVDAAGRAYVGARNPVPGGGGDEILLVTTDGDVRVAADAMRSPNGMVVTDDGSTLVVAETSEARLTAFSIADDGSLGNRRVMAHVPGRHPDGICLDDDGGIWFGSPLTEEFVRVDALGTVTHTLTTPGVWAVACALGGPEGRTLFGVVGDNSIENLQRLGNDREADRTSDARGEVRAFHLDALVDDRPTGQ
jgi:sugar lactone lactonase YvrE